MIICTKCSTTNADGDEFCGGCGEFLEWTGQKIAPPTVPAPELQPEPAPDPATTELAPERAPIAEPTPGPAPIAERTTGPAPKPEPRPEPQAAPRPQPVEPQPVQPAAVLPSKPVPQRAEPAPVVKAEPVLRPGESACPSCGAGNEADRSFCRRCGASLAPAPEGEKKPSWWRKLVTKEPPKPHAAGERPMRDKKGKFKP